MWRVLHLVLSYSGPHGRPHHLSLVTLVVVYVLVGSCVLTIYISLHRFAFNCGSTETIAGENTLECVYNI